MATDYKEVLVEGVEKTWQRANEVFIDNSYGSAPKLSFKEETRTLTPSGKTFATMARCKPLTVLFKPAETVELISPVTDLPITQEERDQLATAISSGVFPQSLVHLTIYSVYKQACAQRDTPSNNQRRD